MPLRAFREGRLRDAVVLSGYGQMLQAARSGKQNIAEGRSDAAASVEIEV